MEVASMPTDESRAAGHVTKRLLQGRPLPAILVDNHPGPRYPTFRPHQRRLSQQKGGAGREGASTPCDSGVSFSSPEGGDPLPHLLTATAASTTTTAGKAGQRGGKVTRGRKKKKRRTPVPPPTTAMGATPAPATTTTSGIGATGTGTVGASTGTGQSTGGGAGGGQAGLMSSTSSGISSGPVSDLPQRKAAHKASRLGHYGRATTMEGADYYVNPEPVPFMPSNFLRYHGLLPFGYPRSSTMLKKIPIPKRHQDTFGGYEYNFTGQRGVMLHTDRYQVRKQYEALKTLEGLNQRDRLLAEMAYLEDLRGVRRRREVVPHRVQLDLFLGGKRLECEERFDIKREIQRLKAMAMPSRARDLFHGKGIQLPPTHMSVLPRPSRGPGEDSDSEEEVRISAPASLQRAMDHSFNLDLHSPTFERRISMTLGDVPQARSFVQGKRHPQLPGIGKTQPSRADPHNVWNHHPTGFRPPRKRTARLHTGLHTPRPTRDDTNMSTSQPSVPPTSRSAAWVEEQNQILSGPVGRTPVIEEEDVPRPAPAHKEDQARLALQDLSPQAPSSRSEEAAGMPPGSSAADAGMTLEEVARPVPARGESGQGRGRAHVLIKEDEGAVGSQEGRQASPPVSHTPNPLKAGMELDVSEEQESSLRQTFERLDTDMDGHLQYHQLKSQLPKEFSRQQEWFVKQVYEITRSSAAFFGVDEFLMMTQLTNRVAALTGKAQEAYGKIDFDTLEGCIIKYVDLFQRADSSQKGRISSEVLRQLLGQSQDKPAPGESSHVWNTILDSVSLDYASHVNHIEYLAHIPLFMALVPPTLPTFPSQSQQSSPDQDQ